MTLRSKHILGWVLFVPCLVGVVAAIGFLEGLFWTRAFSVAWLVHSLVAFGGFLIITMHYAEKWKQSNTRWQRWYSYVVDAIPQVIVVVGGITGYSVLWVLYWQTMVIGHLLGAVGAGAIIGILLVRAKTDA